MRTVVSGGWTSRKVGMSSKPATAMSSGTRWPCSRSAAIAPTAITSLTANTASTSSPRSSSSVIATYPPSRVNWVAMTFSSGSR